MMLAWVVLTNALKQSQVGCVLRHETPLEVRVHVASDDVRRIERERESDVTQQRTGAVVADVTLALQVAVGLELESHTGCKNRYI